MITQLFYCDKSESLFTLEVITCTFYSVFKLVLIIGTVFKSYSDESLTNVQLCRTAAATLRAYYISCKLRYSLAVNMWTTPMPCLNFFTCVSKEDQFTGILTTIWISVNSEREEDTQTSNKTSPKIFKTQTNLVRATL